MLVEKGDAAHGVHGASTALDNAQQTLEPHDATARALFHEAKQQHHAGRIAEAAQLYHRVLSIEPRHAETLHLLGVAFHQCGQHEQAAELIAQAIRLRGEAAHYRSNLGNALAELQRFDEAIESYRRALALCPALAETHCNLAVVLKRQGRLAEAAACYRRSLEIEPALADAHAGLGAIHLYRGMTAEAVACYERALQLDSSDADAHNSLGWALHLQGRFTQALRCYERALAVNPNLADACNNMGFTLQALGRSEAALAFYERALSIDPAFAEAANNLGNALKECGQFARAMASYDRALAIRPNYPQAHYNRADLKSFGPGDPDLRVLERLAETSTQMPAADAAFVHFALAKALDDTGEADRAFRHLLHANALKRQQIDYDETALTEFFQRLRHVFSREFLERRAGTGDTSEAPIFVLGMPRSGSTLVEQILSCHPRVQTAGERTDLEHVIAQELQGRYPESVQQLSAAALLRIGTAYLARLPALQPGRDRIVDKLPGNFMHIGLIRAVLPNARIVHVVRDPLDTCLSCFFKLFRDGQAYSYDLAELGRYYRRYSELMQHWREVLPEGSICEISYERLVADLPSEAQRLVAYCGLPWDERCLGFHAGSRVVQTASAVQVRKPIFSSSVRRSTRYVSHLQPLIAALTA